MTPRPAMPPPAAARRSALLPGWKRFSALRPTWTLVGWGLAYYAAAVAAALLGKLSGGVIPLWPAAGIAMAGIFMSGSRAAPYIFLGSVLSIFGSRGGLAVAVVISTGNLFAAWAGASALRRVLDPKQPVLTLRAAVVFLIPVAYGAALISATWGLVARLVFDLPNLHGFAGWVTWWLGNALGIIVVGPLILSWRVTRTHYDTRRRLELGAVFALAIATCTVFFLEWPVRVFLISPYVVSVPILVWVAMRFGTREAVTMVAVVAAYGTARAEVNVGVLANAPLISRMLANVGQLTVLALTALTISAIVVSRRAAEQATQRATNRITAMLRALPDIVVVQDRQGRYLEHLPTATSAPMIGLVGRDMKVAYPPDVVALRRTAIGRALDTGAIQVVEHPFVRDGNERWLETRVVPLDRTTVLSLVRDMTDQRAAALALQESEAKFRLISENMRDMVCLHDTDARHLYVSPSARDVLGYAPEELVGRTSYEILHPDDAASIRRNPHRGATDGAPGESTDFRVRTKGGRYVWMEARTQPVRDDAGNVVAIVSSSRDVTQRRAMEQQLRLAALVADSATDAVLVTDSEQRIEWVNAAFTAITGDAETEAAGRSPWDYFGAAEGDTVRDVVHAAIARGERWEGEGWARRRDGSLAPITHRVSHVRDAAGTTAHHVHIVTDRSREKHAEEVIQHLASHDSLTRLPNRSYLLQALGLAVTRAERTSARIALLTLNLDRFSRLNESLGQEAGDHVLRETAERILVHAGDGDVVARVGDDEFAILLQAGAGHADAAATAQRITQALAQPFSGGGERDLYLTASIGISLFPEDGATPDVLVKASAAAMAHAKGAGGNGTRFYYAELESHASSHLDFESALRRALATKQGLAVHYQPKIALGSRKVSGAEALARWHSAEFGSVPPAKFVELAENIGAIHELGEWVLRTACDEARRWADLGHTDLVIAVNLSVKQLLDEAFPQRLARVLEETGLPAHQLELEVTESFGMSGRLDAARSLSELAALGCRLALDDFGTGYSSLSYVAALPIDTIKLDRSFVHGLPGKDSSVAIAKAVLAMGGALGLTVVAEGVENQDELAFLAAHACTEVQGYLFAPALTSTEFIGFLRRGVNWPSPVPPQPALPEPA